MCYIGTRCLGTCKYAIFYVIAACGHNQIRLLYVFYIPIRYIYI